MSFGWIYNLRCPVIACYPVSFIQKIQFHVFQKTLNVFHFFEENKALLDDVVEQFCSRKLKIVFEHTSTVLMLLCYGKQFFLCRISKIPFILL